MAEHGTQRMYENSFEQLPYEVLIFNSEGVILSANRAFSQLIGYSSSELCKMNFVEIQSNTHIDVLIEELNNQGDVYGQTNFNPKNGAVLSRNISYKYINENLIQGVITKTYHADKVLDSILTNEDSYLHIISNIHDVIYLIDLKKNSTLYVSPAFELFLARRPAYCK